MRRLTVAIAIAVFAAPIARPHHDALEGHWRATFTIPDRGEVVVRMTLERRGDHCWTAFSRPGAAREMVSWWKYQVGRITGDVPPRGALVAIDGCASAPPSGTPRFRGTMTSPMLGNFVADVVAAGEGLHGDLKRDSTSAVVGSFSLMPDSSMAPIRDYARLGDTIRRTLLAQLYDPRLAQSKTWTTFYSDLSRALRRATDDVDALAAFYARLPHLRLSHINLVRDPALARLPLDSLVTRVWAPPDSLVRLQFLAPKVAYLRVRKWDQVSSVIDRAFARIDSVRAPTLIIDIRDNPGGDNSVGAPLAHLFPDTSFAGVMLTNKWFASHDGPPSGAALASLPVVTRDAGIDLIHAMREHGGVRIGSAPRAPYFAGKVYVLISGGSGSASEPFAHHLKRTNRATLIGERTAGRMLMSLPHALGDGWVLLVAEADFYSVDGTRLENNGVTPHIGVRSREAIVTVGNEIGKTDPYSGALVRSLAFAGLTQWREAVKAYHAAIAIGPAAPNLRRTLEREIQRRLAQVPNDRDALAALRDLGTPPVTKPLQ